LKVGRAEKKKKKRGEKYSVNRFAEVKSTARESEDGRELTSGTVKLTAISSRRGRRSTT